MSPVIARSTEIPRPPGPPPHVPIVQPPPPVAHVAVPQVPVLPPRWQYKRLTQPVDAPEIDEVELNTLGCEGWELVGVVMSPQGAQFYFKRERP